MPIIETNPRWKLFFQPDWFLAFAVSAVVLWLHFYFLFHAGGFWRDEVNLLNLSSRHSFHEMERDSFPVLMPALVAAWSALGLGQTDFEIRILGMLIGVGIVCALWLAAWKIRRAPPLIGLALLALNSTVILFGDSLRAYGLGSLAVLLTAAAAGIFLKKPTWRRAIILAAFAILSAQAMYQNAVFVAAICFGAWAVCWRGKNVSAAKKILFVAIISAASLLPYWREIAGMPSAAKSLRSGFQPELVKINLDNAMGFPMQQYSWFWIFFTVTAIAGASAGLFANYGKKFQRQNLLPAKRTSLAVALAAAFGVSWFAASPETRWMFFPVIAAAIIYFDSEVLFSSAPEKYPAVAEGDLRLFAGVTLLVAIVLYGGFLSFAQLPTEPWYFLPLMALAVVCFEISLPRGLHARAAVFGFAAVTAIIGFRPALDDLDWRFTNVDLIAQRLESEAQPGDFIIVSPWPCGITFSRYFHGAVEWNTLPPLADHSIHRYDLVLEEMKTSGAIQPVLKKVSVALQSGHRVWIVGSSVELPETAAPLPEDLPEPPLKFSGWSDRAYNWRWQAQMSQFLKNHCRDYALDYFTTNQNVNFTECLKLKAASGWRE